MWLKVGVDGNVKANCAGLMVLQFRRTGREGRITPNMGFNTSTTLAIKKFLKKRLKMWWRCCNPKLGYNCGGCQRVEVRPYKQSYKTSICNDVPHPLLLIDKHRFHSKPHETTPTVAFKVLRPTQQCPGEVRLPYCAMTKSNLDIMKEVDK